MSSEFRTLADAVGEGRDDSPAFAAGVDFDSGDSEECEIVGHASQRHGLERAVRDEREHSDLRRRVDELEAERAGMSVSDYHAEIDQADRVLRHGD